MTVPEYLERRYASGVRIVAGVLMAVGGSLNLGIFPLIEARFLAILTGLEPRHVTWVMAGLLAAALWLNFATAVGAPVSTTHSIVGGVLGAGVAAGAGCVVQVVRGIQRRRRRAFVPDAWCRQRGYGRFLQRCRGSRSGPRPALERSV